MKIFVTGSTGFIGKAVVAELFNGGFEVIAAGRRIAPDLPDNILQVSIGDLSDIDCFGVLKGVEVVIHTAARVHIMNETVADPLTEFRKINTESTLNLAKQAANVGVKRFVFISSIGVIGGANDQLFSESIIPDPHGAYAISKYEAELGLLALAKEVGLEVVIIRPPLVYGSNAPGNFGNLVYWVNKGVPLPLGSVYNQRSLVALDNLVSFITLCADYQKSPKAKNEIFVISDNEDVSTTELLQKIAKAFGKKPLLFPIPVWMMIFVAGLIGKGEIAKRLFGSLLVDSSKARKLLGWKPVITMDEQLAKMAKVHLDKKNLRKLV